MPRAVPVEQLPKSQRPRRGTSSASRPEAAVPVAEGGHFDLNVQKVLEHWPVAFALREFIANALDEQALSQSGPIEITEVSEGVWCIRDFGRGLSYLHLTQKENPEKTKHPEVIGQFGIGLKDALAVCDRRRVGVLIRSRHGDITTAQLPKADFADVVTLHGVVSAPSAPTMAGTEVVVSGVSEQDVATAKTFFLRFSGDHQLEETKRGQVLQQPRVRSHQAGSTSRASWSPKSLTSCSPTTSPPSELHCDGLSTVSAPMSVEVPIAIGSKRSSRTAAHRRWPSPWPPTSATSDKGPCTTSSTGRT